MLLFTFIFLLVLVSMFGVYVTYVDVGVDVNAAVDMSAMLVVVLTSIFMLLLSFTLLLVLPL